LKKVRTCIVGAGRAGTVHAHNLAFRIKTSEIVAIIDENLDIAKKLANEIGIKKVYKTLSNALKEEDFDAVFIASPTFTHAKLTIEAAEAGKHVFCEKPMALTLEEADKMILATKKNGVKLQIGFMRRFDSEFKQAKSLIEKGNIGKPILIKSVGRGPGLPPKWACDPKTGIGMLAEVNSHDFDTIRWLMNDEIASVYAEANSFLAPEIAKEFPGFYDVAAVILRLKNGGLGIIDGACPVGYSYDARVEILGTEGLISIGELKSTSLLICYKDMKVISETFRSWRNRFKDAYIAEAESFINSILNDSEPEVTGEDGKKALEAVLAANRSIKEQKTIRLIGD